ncbi:MAG: hypothetical protein RIC53_16580 [Cyclobacteriaceae bacterium]
MLKKVKVALILIAIIGCGVFKDPVLHELSNFLNWLNGRSQLFDVDEFQEVLSSTSSNIMFYNKNLGLLLYYPLYLSLHFLFILTLFDASKFRTRLIVVLLVVFLTVGGCRVVFGIFEWTSLKQYSTHLLKTLFGMPFILLLIEGGRLILQDLEKTISKK